MENKKIKLITIPLAGGSGMYFSRWDKLLDNNFILTPLELPGRGVRFKEELIDDIEIVLGKIVEQLKCEIENYEYILFGYCTGTIFVYELNKKIHEQGLKKPLKCILCAHPVPNNIEEKNSILDESEEELMKRWSADSGISFRKLDAKIYLRKFYEVWKSDFLMMEKYRFVYPIVKFDCNLILVAGKSDAFFDKDEMIKWRKFTKKTCEHNFVSGDHDFLRTNESDVINIINKAIQ